MRTSVLQQPYTFTSKRKDQPAQPPRRNRALHQTKPGVKGLWVAGIGISGFGGWAWGFEFALHGLLHGLGTGKWERYT
jgi:hypothetical protein